MSLRRSARNAASGKSAGVGVSEALYQKIDVDGVAGKPTSASRKAAAAKKRKAVESSTATRTDSANLVGTIANKVVPSQATEQLDVTKPVEILSAGLETVNGPSTPLRTKRHRKASTTSPKKSILFKPKPSGVGLVAGSDNLSRKATDHMLDNLAHLNRPAEPHTTNAPVLTPAGMQVVVANVDVNTESPAKKRKAKDLPPDVGSPLKPARATIDTLLKDAEEFLISVDESGKLGRLIKTHSCQIFSPEGLREVVDPFTALASGIIGQQVSGQAASSIRKKFTSLFPDTHPSFPSPTAVLTLDIPTLRSAGLSQRKAEYITGLAAKFVSGELTAEGLVSASDEELIDNLVAVRGLGRWSVEMFACFGLKRMDVFSTGDLGVQRGMAAYVGRDVSKLKSKGGKWKYMSEQEMLSIASKFSPYRSLFMWYMWQIADVETEVLEQ